MEWKNANTGKWEKMGSFILTKLGFKKLHEKVRRLILGRYKKRKVKLQKMAIGGTKMYKVTFDVVMQDKNGSKLLDTFDIEIPAKAMFFAKKKLVQHLKNNINIHVHDFEIMFEEDDD